MIYVQHVMRMGLRQQDILLITPCSAFSPEMTLVSQYLHIYTIFSNFAGNVQFFKDDYEHRLSGSDSCFRNVDLTVREFSGGWVGNRKQNPVHPGVHYFVTSIIDGEVWMKSSCPIQSRTYSQKSLKLTPVITNLPEE